MSAELLKKYSGLYGQSDVLTALSVERAAAYLLSGEDGDGLCVLARLVAAKLCGIPTEKAFDDHADIAVYPRAEEKSAKPSKTKKSDADRQRRSIVTVDDVRDIVDSLYLTPFESDKRVYIIESAESMSEICQNKLLKSLEEPPSHTCFILCASGRLLPTVESRCIKLELAPFSAETVARELKKYHDDEKAIELATRVSRGNLGMAERILADPDFGAIYDASLEILRLATGSKMFARVAAVYDKFTRERVGATLGIIEYLLNDVARCLVGADTVFDAKDVERAAAGFTPYSAAACAEYVREAKRHNDANCMPVAVMDTTILKIMEEKALCRK